MAEYTETRWRCDRPDCRKSSLKPPGQKAPAGWHEAASIYGNVTHCCPGVSCQMWLRSFCENFGIDVPEGLIVVEEFNHDA